MKLRVLWLLTVGVVIACGSSNAVDTDTSTSSPDDSARGSGGVTSTGGRGSGGGINLSKLQDPTAFGTGGDFAMGGADGAVLPHFACDNPDFFPLRLDDAEEKTSEFGEGGASGTDLESSDVGGGDLTVLVIFDKSGSMNNHWGGKSRWQAGSDAMLLGLDGILDILTIGALVYPLPEEDVSEEEVARECGVPEIESPQQIDFSSGRIFKEKWTANACENQPLGGTPLLRALSVADKAVQSAVKRGLADGRFRVILVTDGAPTCDYSPSDNEAIIAIPTQWSELGIETHVIGLPDSGGAAAMLDAIAFAGGTEKHQAPDLLGGYEALEDELHRLFR